MAADAAAGAAAAVTEDKAADASAVDGTVAVSSAILSEEPQMPMVSALNPQLKISTK